MAIDLKPQIMACINTLFDVEQNRFKRPSSRIILHCLDNNFHCSHEDWHGLAVAVLVNSNDDGFIVFLCRFIQTPNAKPRSLLTNEGGRFYEVDRSLIHYLDIFGEFNIVTGYQNFSQIPEFEAVFKAWPTWKDYEDLPELLQYLDVEVEVKEPEEFVL